MDAKELKWQKSHEAVAMVLARSEVKFASSYVLHTEDLLAVFFQGISLYVHVIENES